MLRVSSSLRKLTTCNCASCDSMAVKSAIGLGALFLLPAERKDGDDAEEAISDGKAGITQGATQTRSGDCTVLIDFFLRLRRMSESDEVECFKLLWLLSKSLPRTANLLARNPNRLKRQRQKRPMTPGVDGRIHGASWIRGLLQVKSIERVAGRYAFQ